MSHPADSEVLTSECPTQSRSQQDIALWRLRLYSSHTSELELYVNVEVHVPLPLSCTLCHVP